MKIMKNVAIAGVAFLATHGCTPQAITTQPIAETSSLTFTDAEIKAFKCPVALPKYTGSNALPNGDAPLSSRVTAETSNNTLIYWVKLLNNGSLSEINEMRNKASYSTVPKEIKHAVVRNLALRKLKKCADVEPNMNRYSGGVKGADFENVDLPTPSGWSEPIDLSEYAKRNKL